jgi:hypothetical protein
VSELVMLRGKSSSDVGGKLAVVQKSVLTEVSLVLSQVIVVVAVVVIFIILGHVVEVFAGEQGD